GAEAESPIWVPCEVRFRGKSWRHVGVRFKGNSSQLYPWANGSLKLPLKLDFDKYEDEYPETKNQRFYGFGKLSLANNYGDPSLIRERVADETLRAAGLRSARAAFYRVYVDHGEGPVYFGLYTLVETMEDTVLRTQFEDGGGDLYKPDGPAASFAKGTYREASYYKKTNEDDANDGDVRALYDALHRRDRSCAQWRGDLEAVFDVEGFLRWLAVVTVEQNWDVYGNAGHNYYLYGDPTEGRLTWLPWDSNEFFKASGNKDALPLSLDGVDAKWPLIRFLIDDELYRARYREHVRSVAAEVYSPERMVPIFEEMHALVAPAVTGADGERIGYTCLESPGDFLASLPQLIEHVNGRESAVAEYLAGGKTEGPAAPE
ncbi:MAG: CotH kinase family protein, partial [Acidobacteriota bacterium]